MMLEIPEILTPAEAARCREELRHASWRDGRATAGHMAAGVKANEQLADDDPLAATLAQLLLDRLGAHPRFLAAALPHRILPPRFNRYRGGGTYGDHVDNAVFSIPGTPHRVRSDLSATLFLSEPGSYEGGALVIGTGAERRSVKLAAGHLLLYSATSVHRVEPVTKGARLAAFFWIQSMVREDRKRAMLLDLDDAVRALAGDHPGHPSLPRLTGLYHDLLRGWADT